MERFGLMNLAVQCQFDSNGRIISQTDENWDGTVWVNDYRSSIEYDSNGRYISQTDEIGMELLG